MITVTSDIHLNLGNRLEDFVKSLDQIAEIANKTNLLIILGDVYHFRNPKVVEMNAYRDFLNKVKVPIEMIIGNHDQSGEHSSLDEFLKFRHKNIMCRKPPFTLKYKKLKLWLWHGIVEGVEVGPNDYVLGGSNRSMTVKQVKENKADLYLVGDIHKAQVIADNIIYPGSIERVNFGERNEGKYVVVINEETKKFEFKPLKVRPMIQEEYYIGRLPDFDSLYKKAEGAIVKVVLRGTKKEIQEFDDTECRQTLDKLAFNYKIVFERERTIETKPVKEINENNSLTESFKQFAETKKYDEVTTKTGLELLNELA